MIWRHYEARNTGAPSLITDDGEQIDARFELGTVATGKSRVFAGYFVRISLARGETFLGEDQHSLRAALRQVSANLSAAKIELCAAGLDSSWRETGLSANTGWGYLPSYAEPVHMIALSSPPSLS